jgi:Putative adhesin
MKIRIGGAGRAGLAIIVSLACVSATAEAQRAEGSFQRTLTVSGPVTVDVVSGSGRIDVRAGSAGRVEVSAKIQASDSRGWSGTRLSPEERVRRIEANPPIEQSGGTVRIGHIADEDLRNGVSISYTLRVPAATTLNARTGSGAIHVEGVDGRVDANAGSGSLTLRNIGGGVRASTGSGEVTAEAVRGSLHATTGSGRIQGSGVTGAITATTGSGSIDVEQTGSGNVEISTGSGSVRARGVRGVLEATSSSGDVDVQGEPLGDWRLSSSSGSITIAMPSNAGFEVDASTSSGRISTDFPVTVSGTIDRRSLRGSTKDGSGRLLRVRTASGSISIRRM